MHTYTQDILMIHTRPYYKKKVTQQQLYQTALFEISLDLSQPLHLLRLECIRETRVTKDTWYHTTKKYPTNLYYKWHCFEITLYCVSQTMLEWFANIYVQDTWYIHTSHMIHTHKYIKHTWPYYVFTICTDCFEIRFEYISISNNELGE